MLIASWLGVAKSDVGLVGGARSRLKTILVSGDPDELAGLISARMAMSK